MAHKLLITFTVDVSPNYKTLIKPTDAVRGEPAGLSFSATNLETEPFPGGKIKSVKITYGFPTGIYNSWTTEWDCPPLTPNIAQNVLDLPIVPVVEGLSWIHLTIAPTDGQPMEYYQGANEPLIGATEWVSCFYVVNREILLLLNRSILGKGG